LTMLANIRGEVLFNIYGPLEDRSYWERCRLIIEGMPSNIHVYYRGEVRHEEVYAVLKAHDLFYLPTTGENFGHAIYESLSAGCPILISDRTPWRDVKGGGWSVPLEQPETFAAILQKCVDMNMEEWEVLSRNAFACAVERTVGQESIQQHRDIFACSNVTR
jgi:glycosyltransferase involved in cell wall biosynthesis